MARNVYIAIMVAAAKGNGLHLTADEVFQLSTDDAIETHAANCLDESDWPERVPGKFVHAPGWASIDPKKERKGANLTCIAPEDMSR